MNTKRFLLISGGIFFLFMLVTSYLFVYNEFLTSLKFSIISTLVFVPVNFLLNKLFNKKAFTK